LSAIRDLVGTELGPTSWLDVTQERIDAFAAATSDPQWIHVDPERAAEGPFGTTIAHGFLTLSLCVPMLEVLPPGGAFLNYGTTASTFPAPVPSGSVRPVPVSPSRVRLSCVPGWRRGRVRRPKKPVCVAELAC
jgi:acyl dehydratase